MTNTDHATQTPAAETSHSFVVEIENLVRHFGDFTAVDHINLRIRGGQFFGFLGPNGAEIHYDQNADGLAEAYKRQDSRSRV
jgi:ABC-type uncharacterized transport system ATPase subunit